VAGWSWPDWLQLELVANSRFWGVSDSSDSEKEVQDSTAIEGDSDSEEDIFAEAKKLDYCGLEPTRCNQFLMKTTFNNLFVDVVVNTILI
jgi:hypothetical protein